MWLTLTFNSEPPILAPSPLGGFLLPMIRALQSRPVRYFREAKAELEKVAWPTKRDTVLYSGVVVALCLALAFYSGVVDYALNEGLAALVSLI